MVDKAKTKRIMKQFTPKRAAIAKIGSEPLELPNYSGVKRSLNEGPQDFDLREGTIQHTQTEDKHIANKKYVDDEIAGIPAPTWTESNNDVYVEGKDVQVKLLLGPESLNETDFATHAKWDVTADWDDTGGDAVYLHNSGMGIITQITAKNNIIILIILIVNFHVF